MEKMGFVLWESLMLLFVILAGFAVLVIRRKASGRPVFTRHDWLTYFGDLQLQMSRRRLAFRLSYAASLCSLLALISNPILVRLGPGLYAVPFVFICLGIIKGALR